VEITSGPLFFIGGFEMVCCEKVWNTNLPKSIDEWRAKQAISLEEACAIKNPNVLYVVNARIPSFSLDWHPSGLFVSYSLDIASVPREEVGLSIEGKHSFRVRNNGGFRVCQDKINYGLVKASALDCRIGIFRFYMDGLLSRQINYIEIPEVLGFGLFRGSIYDFDSRKSPAQLRFF
jgi:hypothetical protein